MSQVSVNAAAVGATTGERTMRLPLKLGFPIYGHAHITEGAAVHPTARVRQWNTMITSVDAWVKAQGIDRVTFIKIDVEGFEWPILRSSLADINAWRSLVLFEFNSWCQLAFAETSPVDFARWILASFRDVFLVRPGRSGSDAYERVGADAALYLVHTNLIQDGCETDILATNDPDRLRGAIR